MKRVDYQNPNDDLEEITDRSNAEVRAWGRKVLADADALLLSGQIRDGGDLNLIPDDDDEIAIAPEPEVEESQTKIVDSDVESPAKGKRPKPATTS